MAKVVFDDPLHLSEENRVVDDELRWRTIGEVNGKVLLLAALTVECEDAEVIRIISAREAAAGEERVSRWHMNANWERR